MITEEKFLCDCGSEVSSRSRYCGFCGNRIEITHTNYVRTGDYQVVSQPEEEEEVELDNVVDYDMTSPAWIKVPSTKKKNRVITKVSEVVSRPKKIKKGSLKAGSPVPIFLIMTSVMIWIGGVIFFFVEVTF